MGAEEINRRKGHDFLMVAVYLINKRVLFATHGQYASDRGAFADELLGRKGDPKVIQHVASTCAAPMPKGE